MEEPKLTGLRVAILAGDMFEESELTEPRRALEDAGATTELISPKAGKIVAAKHFDKGAEYKVDTILTDADPADYDALLLPGGALNADQLRIVPEAQHFVREFDNDNKPIAVICHGPWLLVSSGLVAGRTLTSYHTIADDIRNAGGIWLDNEVVRDTNWVSSRHPADIPAFNDAMIGLFEDMRRSNEIIDLEMSEPAFRESLDDDKDLPAM